jgi:hypothetical protein
MKKFYGGVEPGHKIRCIEAAGPGEILAQKGSRPPDRKNQRKKPLNFSVHLLNQAG